MRSELPAGISQPLSACLTTEKAALKLLLEPHSGAGLGGLSRCAGGIALLSGPEGGFSDAEVQAACAHGYRAIKLGPRILRTETAAVAALAALQTLWGDMG